MRVEPLHELRESTGRIDHRWWKSARQRILILTFDTIEEAEAWDQNPTTEGLLIQP